MLARRAILAEGIKPPHAGRARAYPREASCARLAERFHSLLRARRLPGSVPHSHARIAVAEVYDLVDILIAADKGRAFGGLALASAY